MPLRLVYWMLVYWLLISRWPTSYDSLITLIRAQLLMKANYTLMKANYTTTLCFIQSCLQLLMKANCTLMKANYTTTLCFIQSCRMFAQVLQIQLLMKVHIRKLYCTCQ